MAGGDAIDSRQVKFLEVPFSRMRCGIKDVIILCHPGILGDAACKLLLESAKGVFPNNRIVVVEEGMKIGIISRE